MLTCAVKDCGKDARTRGLCHGHYHRLTRYGSPTGGPNPRPVKYAKDAVCAVDGCVKPRKARDWCPKHYRRWKMYGDPSIALRPYGVYRRLLDNGYIGVYVPGHPLAGKNGYALEHRYVMYELGHDIAGMHVHHLDHDKTNNDPANLVVLTPGEHGATHDEPNAGQFQRQTHCKRGHEFTPETTYTWNGGKNRECYICKRDKWLAGRSRRYFADDVKAAAVADYVAGMTTSELSEKYGANPGTFRVWAKAAGAPVRPAGRRSNR